MYKEELEVVLELENEYAMYGVLVTLRSLYPAGIPAELSTLASKMADKLRKAGWELNLSLSEASSGCWLIPPNKPTE